MLFRSNFYVSRVKTLGNFPTNTNYWTKQTISPTTLTSKVIGQINQINLARNASGQPVNRGEYYSSGDPVIVYGGLNENIPNPVGAIAEVGNVTSGFVTTVNVIDGGYGYSLPPNTIIHFDNVDPTRPPLANVFSLNTDLETDVFLFPYETISNITNSRQSIQIGDGNYKFLNGNLPSTANVNTKIGDALGFKSFASYPISYVNVENGGAGINKTPIVKAHALEQTDVNGSSTYLGSMGMLSPLKIITGGVGYQANDVIVFSGGSGLGANAIVTTVNSNGAITGTSYRYNESTTPHKYPLGGFGYRMDDLPSVSVNSANVNAHGATLIVTSIMGEGAVLVANTQRVGAVTDINIINYGEDYVAKPNVSLSVQDIVVSNANIILLPQKGDIAYQGSSLITSSYRSTLYETTLLQPNANVFQELYNIRVYNYNTQPNPSLPIKFSFLNENTGLYEDRAIYLRMANTAYAANTFAGHVTPEYNQYGVKTYEIGRAHV